MNKTSISISALLTIIIMFNFTSCAGESKSNDKTVPKKEVSKIEKPKKNFGDFKYGTWKIDSVGENNIIIDRLTEDSVIQVFNFKYNEVFSAMEVLPTVTKDRPIGTWKVANDSVFIISKSGQVAMRYGFEFIDNTLILKGNFQISSKNKKKPSFYLSKYIKKQNRNVNG
jgi:hypothetical protein